MIFRSIFLRPHSISCENIISSPLRWVHEVGVRSRRSDSGVWGTSGKQKMLLFSCLHIIYVSYTYMKYDILMKLMHVHPKLARVMLQQSLCLLWENAWDHFKAFPHLKVEFLYFSSLSFLASWLFLLFQEGFWNNKRSWEIFNFKFVYWYVWLYCLRQWFFKGFCANSNE